jgi:hypothetical protein
MITFYRTPKDEREGIGFWINIFLSEDHWFYSHDLRKKYNPYRKLQIRIHIDFIIWFLEINIPIKHVGNTYYGKKMKDE